MYQRTYVTLTDAVTRKSVCRTIRNVTPSQVHKLLTRTVTLNYPKSRVRVSCLDPENKTTAIRFTIRDTNVGMVIGLIDLLFGMSVVKPLPRGKNHERSKPRNVRHRRRKKRLG